MGGVKCIDFLIKTFNNFKLICQFFDMNANKLPLAIRRSGMLGLKSKTFKIRKVFK